MKKTTVRSSGVKSSRDKNAGEKSAGEKSAGANSSLSKQPDRAGRVDVIVEAAMKYWGSPGAAVAVVVGDEVAHLRGYGVKRHGSSDPVTIDSLFACASTTKAFTAAVIGMLVDEKKMAWDDPVRKHIDYFRLSDSLADTHVTIRDCLCHRTGLSRHDMLWYKSGASREDLLRKLALLSPASSFRSRYEYQNILYLAAGFAAGRAAGVVWDELVRSRIFEPLGMTGANTSAADAQKAPDHAEPHAKYRPAGATERSVRPLEEWLNFNNIGPAGTINAGVRDLARWVRLQLAEGVFEGKRIISREALLETRAPQIVVPAGEETRAVYPDMIQASYGLGWSIQDYRGHHYVSHSGGIDGFRSRITLAPREQIGIVCLSNVNPSSMVEAVTNSILDLYLGLPEKDWSTAFGDLEKQFLNRRARENEERQGKRHSDAPHSRELSCYTGAFEEPAYGTVHVSLESGRLMLQWSSFTRPLEHWHFDTFVVSLNEDEPERQHVVFSLDAAGEVASVNLLDREFRRRQEAAAKDA